EASRARATGVSELDRVLGGGLVPGVVVLLAGEPGVGKSTLLLEVAYQWAANSGASALYVTGEESAGQVRLRAERTGNVHARGRHTGEGGDRGARRAGEGTRTSDSARRARHQGRVCRRAQGVGAPRGRRTALRGRQALHTADGPWREEPVRCRRRDRLLRTA